MRLKFCRPPEHFAHLNHPGAAALRLSRLPSRAKFRIGIRTESSNRFSSVPRKPVHTHRRIVKHGRALSR